jgi:outer membrane protein
MKGMLLLLLFALIGTGSVWANDAKIGFVNTDRIFRESQLAIRAQKKLEREFSTREQEIQKQIKQARDLQSFIEKEGLTLSEAERAKRERELANLNRDIQRAQREFREDLNQRKNEEFAAVHERARKAIIELAEKEKFDLILENVVYASPRVDITDRVIRILDR